MTKEDFDRVMAWAGMWAGPGVNGPVQEFPTNESIARVLFWLHTHMASARESIEGIDAVDLNITDALRIERALFHLSAAR